MAANYEFVSETRTNTPAPPPETAEERLEGAALAIVAALLRQGAARG